MVCIVCKKSSKTGNEYICLSINDVMVFVDDKTLRNIALSAGYSMRDVYSLHVGEVLTICD